MQRWKREAKQASRSLEIELWAANSLTDRLSRRTPQYAGRLAFWFDATVLTPDWFRERFAEAREGLGARYVPETNIELPIRRTMQGFCRDPAMVEELEAWSGKVNEFGYRSVGALKQLDEKGLQPNATDQLAATMSEFLSALAGTSADPDYIFPITEILGAARAMRKESANCEHALWDQERSNAKGRDNIQYAASSLRRLSDVLEDIAEAMNSDRWQIANSRRLLVNGDAGVGKSHLFGDIVEHQIAREWPAVLILSGTLVEGDPWSQIIAALHLQGISTETLLGALDAAGQAAGTRAVIFVDAINERHGIDLWAARLPLFLKSIEAFPHVAIALSCRSTYLRYIIPDERPISGLSRVDHVGFAGNPDAANEYLDRRGIVRVAAPNLIPEFYNPLFLKTCCDFLEREGQRELPRGLTGVTSIFEFYSQAIARTIERRLKLDRNRRIVSQALQQLASAFDEGYRGYTDVSTANAILDKLLPPDGTVDRSLLAQLESEGVLAIEPTTDDDASVTEVVRFTFERYSDHRIATLLLGSHLDTENPSRSFEPGSVLHEYILGDRAYERAGVVEAFAVQIPERCGQELPDLVSTPGFNGWLVYDAFEKSVLWRDQKCFTRRTLELLERNSQNDRHQVLRTLVAISTEPDNQFNVLFLHERLMKLKMPERDGIWSVFLVDEGEEDGSPVETLITWSLRNGLNAIDDSRAELAAIALSWMFSTSHRAVRDRATKSLSALLAPRLEIAANLIRRFRQVDDPYVLERVLASVYGGALQGVHGAGLAELARATYESIFEDGRPPVHVLARDYARGIIELALARNTLPADVDLAKVRPPYQSEWPLEEVSDAQIETYTEEYPSGRFTDSIVSSTVNDGDFARYVTDHAVGNWSALGIEWAGITREQVFLSWQDGFLSKHPSSGKLLDDVLKAAADLRQAYEQLGQPIFRIVIVKPGKRAPKSNDKLTDKPSPELAKLERKLDRTEQKLHSVMSDAEWDDYQLLGRPHVQADMSWRRRIHEWPPRLNRGAMRRWICKRAHDLGWTPERFGKVDRNLGGDRHDHRVERIGKKYQWIALHQLVAQLADHLAFKESYGDTLRVFNGPWEALSREMDPSLLATHSHGDQWRQWDRTWWMPAVVKLRPMEPAARLLWLDSPDDLVSSEALIRVLDPKTGRKWFVIEEFAIWNQYGVRQGDRRIERKTWFHLQCILTKDADRDALVESLSDKSLNQRDLPKIEMPFRGYLGEFPWHPVYSDIVSWMPAGGWNGLPVAAQALVTNYLAERSGHDYSIEETFNFDLPSPGLITGLGLHLSNGKELTYSDAGGTVRFFDPSTQEPGPSAALVDHDAFLGFLKREGLAAIWVINGEKSVHGGRQDRGYGGERSITSVYWLAGNQFQRRDHFDGHRATPEQVADLLKE
ncbi:hypothetical protein NKH52_28485 [Mesorhizobium sp. M1066]|uniref:hypothetical protein n=1 Tax=unclassified Mesorhizobium TaxID=325217 RepID=UPI00333C922F